MTYLELSCPRCSASQQLAEDAVVRRLKETGMLRRNPNPSREELRELLLAVAPRLECAQCQTTGLYAREVVEDDDWPEAASCEICGKLIPSERLEVFPETRRCTACQQAEDRGQQHAEPEYCSRCGSPMTVRPRGGSGITRYQMVCPACGKH